MQVILHLIDLHNTHLKIINVGENHENFNKTSSGIDTNHYFINDGIRS